MCGIVGSINVPITLLNLDKIGHRGPDSKGLTEFRFEFNRTYFGQTRLAIVDLSDAGFQPMTDVSGGYTILMNGEIYNHEDLREQIHNVEFKGHSDTETVLYYLIQHGISAVAKLNGIFSIAFLDHKNEKLFLVRDPFGVKPLYYSLSGNKLIFSSEIRVITEVLKNVEIDEQCLYDYLRLRFCPSPLTLYKNILKLEPGHYLQFDLNTIDLKVKSFFYSYVPRKKSHIPFDEALDEYDRLVRAAIERQLMSDVPIAIMLSGGVDSALLAHLAQEISGAKFETFSVGYDIESGANELVDAAETAKWLGSKHNEIIINQNNFTENSGELIRKIEEPVGSQSLYPFSYLTSYIQSKGYKVAFSGQGVDEGMAGYNRYNFQNMFDDFSSPIWQSLRIIKPFIKNDKIRRGLNAIAENNRAKRYIESYSFFNKSSLDKLLNSKQLLSEQREQNLIKLLESKADLYNLNNKNGLDYMLMMDTRLALVDDLLLYTDKLSMQHSLEVRVPFLDIELMQFVESLPTKFKSTIRDNKILHKKLAERYLPKEIIYRRKKGFYIPRNEWYKSEAGAIFKEQILSDNGEFSKFFNKKAVSKLFDDHRTGKYNYEDQIYSLMNLYYWFKTK